MAANITSDHGRHFKYKLSNFGADTKGHDVKMFGDATNKYAEWDASNNKFTVAGTLFIGATAISGTELGFLDGVSAGTVTASKAIVVGASKNIDTLSIANSGLKLGSNAGTAVTATANEINVLDGVTAGTASASKALVCGSTKNLDTLVIANGGLELGSGGTAVSATAAEINVLDGVTAGTATASKALVCGSTKNLDTLVIANGGLELGSGGTAVSATAAEINVLDGVSAGTTTASKALVCGSTKNLDALVIDNSGLSLGSTAITSTAAELNNLDGVTAGTATASKALVCGSTKNLDTLVIANGGLILGSGGTAMTKTSAEINALVGGVSSGYLIARGTQAATASAAINTGLSTIVGFSVTPYADTGTKINTAPVVSGVKSSGATLTVYRWKCATPSTATWVAATTAGTIAWTAVGT